MIRFGSLVLLGCCLFTAGCARTTSFEGSVTIPKGAPYVETEIRGPKAKQTYRITVDADAAVKAYVVLAENKEDVVLALRADKKVRNTLAASDAAKEAELEADIPAGKSFVVILQPAGKPETDIDVSLKIRPK